MTNWLDLKNPETDKSGKDIVKYMKRKKWVKGKKPHLMQFVRATGIAHSYLNAFIKADKPIKKNLMDRIVQGCPDFLDK